MNRRNFLKGSAVFGGALAALGPFQAVSARRALGAAIAKSEGYGPLVNKGDLWLPVDFARTAINETEFCGGCFDPAGKTFYLNQQGERGSLPGGPANARAVTYAIYGPF